MTGGKGSARGGDVSEDEPMKPSLSTVAETVSRRVRSIRVERGFSLRSVAATAQISPSLLSQIERGTASPSLVSLAAIADALGVRPGELLDGSGDELQRSASRVVRRSERRVIDGKNCRREYLMHVHDPYLEVAELSLPPAGSSRPSLASHSGRDYAIVLAGTATVEFSTGRERLFEGDYIAFDASEPHRVVNESESDTTLIWIIAHEA